MRNSGLMEENPPQTDPAYLAARRQVRKLKGFYSHLSVYCLVLLGLLAINAASSYGHWWVQWVAFGWGIGVVAHGLSTFAFCNLFGADWEQRKIASILAKNQQIR